MARISPAGSGLTMALIFEWPLISSFAFPHTRPGLSNIAASKQMWLPKTECRVYAAPQDFE